MQDNYNFWHVRQTVNLEVVEKIEFRAASLVRLHLTAFEPIIYSG